MAALSGFGAAADGLDDFGVSHGVAGLGSLTLDLWFEPARVGRRLVNEEPSSSDTRLGSRGLLGIVNGSIGGQAGEPRY